MDPALGLGLLTGLGLLFRKVHQEGGSGIPYPTFKCWLEKVGFGVISKYPIKIAKELPAARFPSQDLTHAF